MTSPQFLSSLLHCGLRMAAFFCQRSQLPWGGPSHRSSFHWDPLLAPSSCHLRDPELVTAPTVARPRVFQDPLLASLDSAHPILNSLFVKLSLVSPFGVIICFLLETDIILDILYPYTIYLLLCTPLYDVCSVYLRSS